MKFAIQVAFLCAVAVTAFPANEVKDALPGQVEDLEPADDLETAATINLGSLASLASIGVPKEYQGSSGSSGNSGSGLGKGKVSWNFENSDSSSSSSSSEEHVHHVHGHSHSHYDDWTPYYPSYSSW